MGYPGPLPCSPECGSRGCGWLRRREQPPRRVLSLLHHNNMNRPIVFHWIDRSLPRGMCTRGALYNLTPRHYKMNLVLSRALQWLEIRDETDARVIETGQNVVVVHEEWCVDVAELRHARPSHDDVPHGGFGSQPPVLNRNLRRGGGGPDSGVAALREVSSMHSSTVVHALG